ncbi:uncharacterized protein M421DRAFT_144125 [Didymella exigua CBS 183.55]|uniref:Uncharacterized protein n=1 Tax=Didymella exigua CBS 183.55 TaxID=1150837 RepID=A0A6A5RMX5_9PLEO|nr:uncharacterized protein M421DRAFT_144125 [Didymella exigua CBS 183.55]KAF1928989.1 hypothetical protein M421DRAFT_144125 [Didymella exigua CBS 183.55]
MYITYDLRRRMNTSVLVICFFVLRAYMHRPLYPSISDIARRAISVIGFPQRSSTRYVPLLYDLYALPCGMRRLIVLRGGFTESLIHLFVRKILKIMYAVSVCWRRKASRSACNSPLPAVFTASQLRQLDSSLSWRTTYLRIVLTILVCPAATAASRAFRK